MEQKQITATYAEAVKAIKEAISGIEGTGTLIQNETN